MRFLSAGVATLNGSDGLLYMPNEVVGHEARLKASEALLSCPDGYQLFQTAHFENPPPRRAYLSN